jgi:hypothetical protein
LKNALVMPPLPISVGTINRSARAGSCIASYSRAIIRAVLRNAGWSVTFATRST